MFKKTTNIPLKCSFKFLKYPGLKEKIYSNKERGIRISLAKKGQPRKPASKETRENLSRRMKGSGNNFFDHKLYNFSHPIYGCVTSTQHDLYTKYNLLKSHICQIIKGTRKSHKGWKVCL